MYIQLLDAMMEKLKQLEYDHFFNSVYAEVLCREVSLKRSSQDFVVIYTYCAIDNSKKDTSYL